MAENTVQNFLFRRLDGMISLRKGLDAYALRQKTIAANVANSETPGYKARKVDFENQLRAALNKSSSALTRTSPDHVPVHGGLRAMESVKSKIIVSDKDNSVNGINNVDIEKQMADMATNQIQFAAASKILGTRYQLLKGAILGRM